jgi:NADH-quinone oxidoreductase subunit M
VVSTTVIITGAIYLLWAYQRTFWIKVSPANRAIRDISWREIGMVAPLLAGIVFLGVYPRVFFDRVTPSVGYLLGHVQHVAPNAKVPASTQTAIKYTIPAKQNVDSPSSSSGVAAGSHP